MNPMPPFQCFRIQEWKGYEEEKDRLKSSTMSFLGLHLSKVSTVVVGILDVEGYLTMHGGLMVREGSILDIMVLPDEF